MNREQIAAIRRAVAADGDRRFARWDEAAFSGFVDAFNGWMFWQLRRHPAPAVLCRAWMAMVAEGVGAGMLGPLGASPRSALKRQGLLAWCLARLIPQSASQMPVDEALSAMATAWNLCEGMATLPAWMGRYVHARCAARDGLRELKDMPDFIAAALAPLLVAPPSPRWEGALSVSTLDLRDAHDHFLPGEIYPVAPSVVCVTDRRDPDAATAIFLRPDGKSELMGPTPALARWAGEGDALPAMKLAPEALALGPREVKIPTLRHPHSHALLPSGFAVVSAVDSQRVWIVESR